MKRRTAPQPGGLSRVKPRGFLLVEAMVSMSVLMVGVLGIFALMSQSIKLTRTINDQYVSTYLAAEGIEVVKNILDSNALTNPGAWNANGFDAAACYELDYTTDSLGSARSASCSGSGATPLLFDGSLYGYAGGTASGFSRTVQIAPIMDKGAQIGIRVRSTVRWAGGEQSFVLDDTFYAWH